MACSLHYYVCSESAQRGATDSCRSRAAITWRVCLLKPIASQAEFVWRGITKHKRLAGLISVSLVAFRKGVNVVNLLDAFNKTLATDTDRFNTNFNLSASAFIKVVENKIEAIESIAETSLAWLTRRPICFWKQSRHFCVRSRLSTPISIPSTPNSIPNSIPSTGSSSLWCLRLSLTG